METEYRDFTTKRNFGIELEIHPEDVSKKFLCDQLKEFEARNKQPRPVFMEDGSEGWAESIDNDYWHVKYDSSCGPLGKKKQDGGGWEIASYVAAGLPDIISIAKAAAHLRSNGVQTNLHCGLHIHVNAEDYTADDMSAMLGHWLRIEAVVAQALPDHRRKNKYCKPLRRRYNKLCTQGVDNDWSVSKLWDYIRPSNLGVHENPDKKYTINTVGWARGDRRTVELRWPECSLDRMHVYNWTLLFVSFVELCKSRPAPTLLSPAQSVGETLEILGLQNPAGGPLLILDENLFLLKLWFLRRLMRFSSIKKIAREAEEKLVYITKI